MDFFDSGLAVSEGCPSLSDDDSLYFGADGKNKITGGQVVSWLINPLGANMTRVRANKDDIDSYREAVQKYGSQWPAGETSASIQDAINNLQAEKNARDDDYNFENKKIVIGKKKEHADKIRRYRAQMLAAEDLISQYNQLFTDAQTKESAAKKIADQSLQAPGSSTPVGGELTDNGTTPPVTTGPNYLLYGGIAVGVLIIGIIAIKKLRG